MRPTLLLLAWLFCGCADSLAAGKLPSERPDARYARLTLTMVDGKGGKINVPVYLRLFDSDKMTALCGFYVLPVMDYVSKDLIPRWIESASVYSGEKPLTSGKFLYSREPGTDELDTEAACVRTNVPYDRANLRQPISLRGDSVHANF
jgi:hypothetical protein